MVTEIRLYVEGGGNGKETRARLREGFSSFLIALRNIAREKRIRWQIIPCGSRVSTFEDYQIALRTHPSAFNVLLVDSDGPVTAPTRPLQYLQNQPGWTLRDIADEQCHLMVQIMESWLIADIEALRRFYGQEFNANSIPRRHDIEQIEKRDVESSLRAATRRTGKGEYHKIHHAPKILEQLDVGRVRNVAQHCDRLFTILTEKMNT